MKKKYEIFHSGNSKKENIFEFSLFTAISSPSLLTHNSP